MKSQKAYARSRFAARRLQPLAPQPATGCGLTPLAGATCRIADADRAVCALSAYSRSSIFFARLAADCLRQRRGHEGIEIAVQHILRRAAFHAGAQILHQLIGLQHIRADLVAPADIGFLADKGAGFGFLLFQFDFVELGLAACPSNWRGSGAG